MPTQLTYVLVMTVVLLDFYTNMYPTHLPGQAKWIHPSLNAYSYSYGRLETIFLMVYGCGSLTENGFSVSRPAVAKQVSQVIS